MVIDQASDVCSDELIVAPTNPSVTFADNTIPVSPESPLNDGYLPMPPPEPPDILLCNELNSETVEVDHEPDSITLWCNRVSTPYCGADLLRTSNVYPPGSLFDPTIQIQDGNLNNFPYPGLKTIPEDDRYQPTSGFGDIFLSL
jgi:hypothetical protein